MIILLLILFLILATLVDWKTKIIPDGLTLLGIIIALHYQFLSGNVWQALLGIDAGIGIIWLMNIIKKRGNFGGGDAKLLAFIGTILGWKVIFVFFISLLLLIGFRKITKNYAPIAFAPFISSGTFLFLFFEWYLICSALFSNSIKFLIRLSEGLPFI